MTKMPTHSCILLIVCLLASHGAPAEEKRWFVTDPVIIPKSVEQTSIKNPSVVFDNGLYHVFFDVFINGTTEEVQYASSPSLATLGDAPRKVVVDIGGAPAVFQHNSKWYMIINHNRMLVNEKGDLGSKAAWRGIGKLFSNQTVRDNPLSGSKAPSWAPLDFWMIADGVEVYLFYAMNNGTVGMTHQPLSIFPSPNAWADHEIAIAERGHDLVFEALHVYHSLADGKFYMAVEGIDGLNRKLALYASDRLGGTWKDGTWKLIDGNWASGKNLVFDASQPWTTMVSHPEAIRTHNGLSMDIADIHDSYWLFMGMRDTDGQGKGYGQWPWRVGVMRNGGREKSPVPGLPR